jgi:AsmA protein
MRPWLRRSLTVTAALLLLVISAAVWLVLSFDGERLKRAAIDWVRTQSARELSIDGPVALQLWPQPAVTVQGVRLSESGQPGQSFATIEKAALTVRLEPLLARREVEIESVAAKGVRLNVRRGADGRRNIDDLLDRAADGGEPRTRRQVMIESIELVDAELLVSDAPAGVEGRFVVQQLRLGPYEAGRPWPLSLQAHAALEQPPLRGSLTLEAGMELRPAPGAPPIVRLVKTSLQLQGQGYGIEDLDARLQADAIQFEYGTAAGVADSHVELDGAQLQFSGARFGWRIDAGQLGLSRLRLDVSTRSLELERLALRLQGRRQQTTLDAQIDWPALKVVGESLQGAALAGRLALGGDQRLHLQLSSQAPSGVFERITVPALHVDAEGQAGSSTLQGKGDATLVISPKPFAVALDPLSLALQMSDPSLPPLRLKLAGNAQISASSGGGRAEGTINDQRFDARVDAILDRPRALLDVDASFGTLDMSRFVAGPDRGSAPATTTAAAAVNLQPLTWADARMRLKVARLLWPPYRVDGLDLQANIDSGALDLQRLAGRAWGGRFDASGGADAGSGRIALRLRASDVDLRALLTDTLGFDGLRGRGRIDADLRSRGRTLNAMHAALNGRVTLALRPAAIRGIDLAQTFSGWRAAPQGGSTTVAGDAGRQTDFSQLKTSLDFRDGVGHSTDLDGRSEFLNVAGEGTIDLARSRIDYLLRARVVNTAGGRAGPEMVMLNGVMVPVELRGPFGDVQWQVRWPSVTAGVVVRSVPNVARGAGEAVGSVLRGAAGAVRGGRNDPATPPSR